MKIPKRKTIVRSLCYITIASGISVLLGWILNVGFLKSVLPGMRAMNPVGALLFILSGIWVHRTSERTHTKDPIAFAIALFISLFSLYHGICYVYGNVNARLDIYLFRNKFDGDINNHILALSTILSFFIIGHCMLIYKVANDWVNRLKNVLLLVNFFSAYISILGYLFKIPQDFRFLGYIPMTLISSLTFMPLSASLIFMNTRFSLTKILTSNLKGGQLLRITLPLVFVLPPIIGYIRLWGENHKYYPSAFGVELNTLAIIISVLLFLTWYAGTENKKELLAKKTEMRLATSENRYKAIINNINEGVLSFSMQGKILFCNESFCAMTGYTENELIGQDALYLLIPSSQHTLVYDHLFDPESSSFDTLQTEIKTKNDVKIWVNIKPRPLNNQLGVQYGIIATVDDITEDLLKLQDLKAFTASAAHDLNSPLSRIINVAELLSVSNLDEEQTELLEILSTTASGMQQLLKDLLLFSKLGTSSLDKQDINLNTVVQRIIDELTPLNYKGTITVYPLPTLPANDAAIRRLYTNLISNAIKYSMAKPQPVIEIGAIKKEGEEEWEEPQIVLYVKDNGTGLSPDSIQNLFTPFKRFHSGIEGNGMGLAIVKRIVEKHGGTIWVEGEQGKGITFFFTLS
ncbi:MAG: PAS domain S-box protein [Chitinophagia bacterium]|nr:PAS domain S-box protein [Chitinophagia bacterium]